MGNQRWGGNYILNTKSRRSAIILQQHITKFTRFATTTLLSEYDRGQTYFSDSLFLNNIFKIHHIVDKEGKI